MGINVGGIDLTASVLDSEYKIKVLEKVIDKILIKMGGVTLTPQELEIIRKEAVAELQKKYPTAGIDLKQS